MNLEENIQRIKQMMISEEMVQSDAWKSLKKTLDVLKNKKKVLLLSCSNRHNWDKNDIDIPKAKEICELALKNDKKNIRVIRSLGRIYYQELTDL